MTANHFLAVDLSDENRRRIAAVLRDSGAADAVPGRRVPIENWHITVRFLGEVSDVRAETLIGRLDESIALDPGRVWLEGIGAFPRPSKASVVYGVIDDPDGLLTVMAALCDEAAVDVGFEPEDRPFVPHLTLSRVRPPVDARHVLATIDTLRVPLDVTAITLMRTRSIRGGVTYDRIHHLNL